MACKFCNELDESKLAMRSEVVKGEVETFRICISCLGKKLFGDAIENGIELSEQE